MAANVWFAQPTSYHPVSCIQKEVQIKVEIQYHLTQLTQSVWMLSFQLIRRPLWGSKSKIPFFSQAATRSDLCKQIVSIIILFLTFILPSKHSRTFHYINSVTLLFRRLNQMLSSLWIYSCQHVSCNVSSGKIIWKYPYCLSGIGNSKIIESINPITRERRRWQSAMNKTHTITRPDVEKCVITTMATSESFSSVASNIWISLPSHLSSIPTLPAFRRALEHHLFLFAYPDSGAKSGKIKPAQCITLCDTPPTTAIAQPRNTMPSI